MTDGRTNIALVTGGAGFIGSHLVDALLADGAQVVCVDNYVTGCPENLAHLSSEARFDFIEADVIDGFPESVRRKRFTRIYSLACPASPDRYREDPEHTLLTSVVGTRNALRLAEETGARLLLTSTSEVYGDPEVHPQPEGYRGSVNCAGPRACYDEGKRAAETLCFDFQRAGRVDVRVARLFNTYGPRMRRDDGRVVSNFISQALAGDDITVYGDGSQTRSFCYVDDIVGGLLRLMESDVRDGAVNLGNPVEVTVRELVEQVLRITGSRSDVAYRPLPIDDPRRRRPDISRARAVLRWEPLVSLDAGLKRTAEWFGGADRGCAQGLDVAAE